jgi:hypothetical protein
VLLTKPARGAPVRSLATACRGCGAYARAPAHAGTAPAASGPACCQNTSADVSACGYCACSFRSSVLKSQKRRKTRQHTSAYVSIRQHTSAYVSIRQHTSAYVRTPEVGEAPRNAAEVEGSLDVDHIRRVHGALQAAHTSAYVSTRQHTSAHGSHTSWT